MLETATECFTDNLRKRQILRFSIEWYRVRIAAMLLQFPQPLVLIAMLGFILDNFDDPTETLDEIARMAEFATESWPKQ
jgi:hypothetical protein